MLAHLFFPSSLRLGKHGATRTCSAVSSSGFHQFSLLYNECSLSAIANWAKGGVTTNQKTGAADVRTHHRPVAGSMFRLCNQCGKWGHYDSECAEVQGEEVVRLADSTRVQRSLCQFVQDDTPNRSTRDRRPVVQAASLLQLRQNTDDNATKGASSGHSHRGYHSLPDRPQERQNQAKSLGDDSQQDKSATKSNTCQICNSAYKPNDLLLCDGCDLLFHRQCLNPPMCRVPDEDWFCDKCQSYDSDVSSVVELEACDGFVIEQRRRMGNELDSLKEEESKGLGFTDGSRSVALGVVPRGTITSTRITSDVMTPDQNSIFEVESLYDEDPDNVPDLAKGGLCWAKRESAHVGMLGRDDFWPAMVVAVDPSANNRMPYLVTFFSLVGAHRVRPTRILPFYEHYEEIGYSRLSEKNMDGYNVYRNALNAAMVEAGFTSLGQILKRAREKRDGSNNGKNLKKDQVSVQYDPVGGDRERPTEWESADSMIIDGIEILARAAQEDVARARSSLPLLSNDKCICGRKRLRDDEVGVGDRDSNGELTGAADLKRRKVDESATNASDESPSDTALGVEQLLGGLVSWVGTADSISSKETNALVPELYVGIGSALDAKSGKLLVRTLIGLDDILLPDQSSMRRSRSLRASASRLSADESHASVAPSLNLHSVEFGASMWIPIEACLLLEAAPKTTTHNFTAPPGKLGIAFLDKRDSEGTIVSRVRTSSSLVGRISPGDSIVAINGEDTSKMTACELRAALSRTAQVERTITVIGGGPTAVRRKNTMNLCEEWLAASLNMARNEAAQAEVMAADEREEQMIELDKTGMVEKRNSPLREKKGAPIAMPVAAAVAVAVAAVAAAAAPKPNAAAAVTTTAPTANGTSTTSMSNFEEKLWDATAKEHTKPKAVVDVAPAEDTDQLAKTSTALESEAVGATQDGEDEVEGEVHLGDGIYEAERIVDEHVRSAKSSGATHYLVKWKGTDETTWEPARNILNQNLVSIFYATRAASKLRKTAQAKDPSSFTSKMIAVLEKGEKILKANIHNPSSPGKRRRICPFCRQHFREASSYAGHVRLHSTVENFKTIKEIAKIAESDWFD